MEVFGFVFEVVLVQFVWFLIGYFGMCFVGNMVEGVELFMGLGWIKVVFVYQFYDCFGFQYYCQMVVFVCLFFGLF